MTGALRKSEDRDGDPLVNPNRFPGSAATRLLLIFLTTSAATAATLSIAVITLQSLTSETQRGASYLILEADLLLLWALAVATYLVHPVIARWDFGGRLRAIAPDDALAATIETMVRERAMQGVAVLVDDDILNVDAIAFGLPGFRKLAIGKGYRLLLSKDPEQFRARIAHELSHIRNGDIDAAFLERGLLISFLLVSLGTASYYTASANVPTPANDIDSVRLVISEALTLLVPTLWFAILWFQHRASVRSREFLADAEAIIWTSGDDLRRSLGMPAMVRWIAYLQNVIRAHPSVADRTKSSVSPGSAGMPRWRLFFALGYLYGGFLSVSVQLITDANFRNGNFQPAVATADDLRDTMLVILNSPDMSFVYVFCMLLGTLALPAILLVCIRNAGQRLVVRQSFPMFLAAGVAFSLAFGVGETCGYLFNPSTVAMAIVGGYPAINPWVMIGPIIYGGALFLFLVAVFPLVAFILRGRRRRSVSTLEWLLFFCLFAWAVGGVLFTGIFAWLGRGEIPISDYSMPLWFYGPAWLGLIGLALVMRNGLSVWGKRVAPGGFSPWLERP